MQIKDFEYFEKNMSSLYRKYGRKFLAIKNRKVIGVYDTFPTALHETVKTEPPGTFLIQECFRTKAESVKHFQGNVLPVPAF